MDYPSLSFSKSISYSSGLLSPFFFGRSDVHNISPGVVTELYPIT
jgi:hypothetical protein